MSEPKRGRGRPRKLPENARHIRLLLVNGELKEFRAAVEASEEQSQTDFARAAVLNHVDQILGKSPPTPGPKRKKKK